MSFAARFVRASSAAGVLGAMLALAGCASSGSDASLTADQATRAACRQQTEQSFNIRNRADLYRPEYGRDAPMSGQAAPQIDRGLADRFSYEQDYQDCLRSRGARQTPGMQAKGVPTTGGQAAGGQTAGGQAAGAAAPAGTAPPAPGQSGSGRSPAVRVPAPAPAAPGSTSDLTRPPSLTP